MVYRFSCYEAQWGRCSSHVHVQLDSFRTFLCSRSFLVSVGLRPVNSVLLSLLVPFFLSYEPVSSSHSFTFAPPPSAVCVSEWLASSLPLPGNTANDRQLITPNTAVQLSIKKKEKKKTYMYIYVFFCIKVYFKALKPIGLIYINIKNYSNNELKINN